MSRIAQIGIAIGALGMMISFMGLFPGMTGLDSTPGFGIIQTLTVLVGFTLLMLGAIIYIKYAYYATKTATLAQQIGQRLALTGLVLAAMSGLADLLGYGSHGPGFSAIVIFGRLQAAGFVASFFMSAIGVLIYALAGQPDEKPSARPALKTTEPAAPDSAASQSAAAVPESEPEVVTVPEPDNSTQTP